MSAASRRALLGSLAAGVAAPDAVAKVVQGAPPSGDAALIRLADASVEAEDALSTLFGTLTTVAAEHAAEAEVERLGSLCSNLVEQLIDTPATTLPGLAAKARATLRAGPYTSNGEPLANDDSDVLRIAVLEELIAMAESEPAGRAP